MPNSGDFYNGMVIDKQTQQHVGRSWPAPRVGFAWDVIGDGKTAVRGGSGALLRPLLGRLHPDLVEQPPLL